MVTCPFFTYHPEFYREYKLLEFEFQYFVKETEEIRTGTIYCFSLEDAKRLFKYWNSQKSADYYKYLC